MHGAHTVKVVLCMRVYLHTIENIIVLWIPSTDTAFQEPGYVALVKGIVLVKAPLQVYYGNYCMPRALSGFETTSVFNNFRSIRAWTVLCSTKTRQKCAQTAQKQVTLYYSWCNDRKARRQSMGSFCCFTDKRALIRNNSLLCLLWEQGLVQHSTYFRYLQVYSCYFLGLTIFFPS